jgi:hypothetical protein
MATIHPGRHRAEIEGDFVVFLIGMRLNRPWKVHRWWPVYRAMPRMLRELQRHPDRGLLGAGVGLLHGGPVGTRPSTATCPRVGLAAAAGHGPVARRGQSAARRVGTMANDEVEAST